MNKQQVGNIQKGNYLIAVFDILGFKNLIVNNSENEDEVFTDIIRTLDSIMPEAVDMMNRWRKDSLKLPNIIHPSKTNDFDRTMYDIIKTIQISQMSDNIIITLRDTDDTALESLFPLYSFFYLLYCAQAAAIMFAKGYPMRGVIEYGSCHIKNSIFIGKPLVAAHDIISNLDFSGVVVSENAMPKFALAEATQIVEMNAPMKGNAENKSLCLDWTMWGAIFGSHENRRDIGKCVLESFASHNKQICSKVESKIKNTETMIRAFSMI